MSYQYEPTRKERRAAKRLRKAGWSVSEPACPDCHGNGYVWQTIPDAGLTIGGTVSTSPCPRGCHQATFTYYDFGLTGDDLRSPNVSGRIS